MTSSPVRVRVLYFGPCRQHAGCDAEAVDLPEGATVRDLLDACCARHPRMAPARESLLVSVDQEYARPSTRLAGGEEVAVLPPLSGGCR